MKKSEAFDRVSMSGKVVTVTGGGRGIGAATARLCAARGASVVIADLDAEPGNETVADIQRDGGTAAFIQTDVTREDDVRAMVDFTVSTFGGLHASFNNAGTNLDNLIVTEVPLAQWQKNLSINLTSVFLCVKYQITHMLANGGGSIVNNSSAAGVVGMPKLVDYTAAKHGVIGITRAMAAEMSGQGIRVNAIVTGATETRLSADYMKQPDLRAMLEGAHPIGRIGKPFELAETVSWLLSDAASFVTGSCVAVDGGYTAM